MSGIDSMTDNWAPPNADEDFKLTSGTLTITPDACFSLPKEYFAIDPSPSLQEYAEFVEEQNRGYERLSEELLGEAVDSISRLVPLQADAETQRLLDTAVEYQETGECDDLEGWAFRLVDDVKDADD